MGLARTPGPALGHESPKSTNSSTDEFALHVISIGSFDHRASLIYIINVRDLSVSAPSLLS